MPAGRLQNRAMLLRGVGVAPTSRRLFDVGGIGTGSSERVFDVEAPPVSAASIRVFDVEGFVSGASERVFDVEGSLAGESVRVFDVEGDAASVAPGVSPDAGAQVAVALAADSAVGATSVTLTSAAGIAVGSVLNVAGEHRGVTSVVGAVVGLSAPLGAAHVTGDPVTSSNSVTPQLSAPAAAGATVVYVTSVVGLSAGSTLDIGGSSYPVTEVLPDGTVYLGAPLAAPAAAGTWAAATTAFLRAIAVYDKAGVRLGYITQFSMTAAPSRIIGRVGSFEFYLPRNSPQLSLVQGDRIVAIKTDVDTPYWAGVMQPRQSTDGRVQVTCPDVFELLRGNPIEFEEEPEVDLGAAAYYAQIVALTNEQRVRDGEVQWATDLAGCTKPAWGDFDYEGDPFGALSEVSLRSNTEFAWRVELSDQAVPGGSQITPVLMARDQFLEAFGADLDDGPDGTVAQAPLYVESPPVANAIRLRGRRTEVARWTAPWARWAVHDFEPTVERAVDPGVWRRRKEFDITVSWGLSKDRQRALARATQNMLRGLFLTFLYAYHDQEGRPYHEGFRYVGAPREVDPHLTTGEGWRTRRALITYHNLPSSAVMVNAPASQILTVSYDRVTGVQTVERAFFSEADGQLYLARLSVHGWITRYFVRNGVIYRRAVTPFDHSSATVASHNTRLMWPGDPDDPTHPQTTYHSVRRIISFTELGAVTEGVYMDLDSLRGPTTGPQFIRPTVGDPPHITVFLIPAPDLVELNRDFIERIWDFEWRRIRDWDPRRDGVGAFLNRRTVVRNAPTTSERWHVVPWFVPGDGETSLSVGVGASPTADTELLVDSPWSLPPAAALPYVLTVGEDPGEEDVLVQSIAGTQLIVARAQNGTEAIIHEAGESVRYTLPEDEEPWDGFVVHVERTDPATGLTAQELDGQPLWPSGEAYADELLTRLSVPQKRLAVQLVNRGDSWATVQLGSRHNVNIASEGVVGVGITGVVRVIGYAPNVADGKMELVCEVLP